MRLAVVLAVLTISTTAHADRAWKRRYLHLGAIGVGSAAFLVTEGPLKPSLAAEPCRWCDPPGLDASIRDALVWSDPEAANFASNVTGFVLAPASALGLLWASTWKDRSAERWIDDGIPVVEAGVFFGCFVQIVKFAAGRQRPFVHHAEAGREPEPDDNLSFFSGHTGSAFAYASAAGTVAHLRGYKLEPVIWASGAVLAGTTGYLRIGADKHWFSDVVVGALLGSAVGVAVPRLLHHRTLTVVPTGDGVLVSGRF